MPRSDGINIFISEMRLVMEKCLGKEDWTTKQESQ
jgi:hypothetical protein